MEIHRHANQVPVVVSRPQQVQTPVARLEQAVPMKLLFILPEYRLEPARGIRTFYANLLPALVQARCYVKALVAHRARFDVPSFTDENGLEVEYHRG